MAGRDQTPDLPTNPPSCSDLRFEATLVNVAMEVASKVHQTDVLSVGLADGQYPSAFLDSERVGGIASGYPGRLAECLRQGEVFDATVLDIQGGEVRVRVEHR
jgi:hypothetical protein